MVTRPYLLRSSASLVSRVIEGPNFWFHIPFQLSLFDLFIPAASVHACVRVCAHKMCRNEESRKQDMLRKYHNLPESAKSYLRREHDGSTTETTAVTVWKTLSLPTCHTYLLNVFITAFNFKCLMFVEYFLKHLLNIVCNLSHFTPIPHWNGI